MIPSGAAAKTQIDETVAKLALRIGKRAAADLISVQANAQMPSLVTVTIEAAAKDILETWFYGRDE